MKVLRRCLPVVLALSFGTVHAQPQADTLSIRFRLDSIRVDMEYAGNAKAWETFVSNYTYRYSTVSPRALRLDIYSGASPEGTAAHNRWLGENRGIAIRRLVRQRLGGGIGSIIVHNEAARWDGLYEAVAASSEPWRDEVLRIIEQPASPDENQRDHRELKLRALRGGQVWPVLLERYLAPLRSGATAVISWIDCPGGRDTIVVRDTVVLVQPMYVIHDSLASPSEASATPTPVLRQPVWILRSNIPLLLTATPNLQAEWSLGHKDKWSVNLEGVWSWWTFCHNAHANEIMYGSAELRRWLGRRWRHHTLSGWHLGLGAGVGYGDLELNSQGYQGEVYSGYVNLGWQHRFGRRRQWSFDAGIGFGYAHVTWRRYKGSTMFPVGKEEHYDDHLMWQETSRTNWIGPVHANISIGYVFPVRDGVWKRERANRRDAARNAVRFERDSLRIRERYEREDSLLGLRLERLELKARDGQMSETRLERLRTRIDVARQRNEERLEGDLDRARRKYGIVK